jgi:hypothetical protein
LAMRIRDLFLLHLKSGMGFLRASIGVNKHF